MDGSGAAQQTLFAGGSLASHGASPGSSEASRMTETSGRKWLGSLKSLNLSGSLERMSAALLTQRWASTAVFLTWRVSATPSRRSVFRLVPWVRHTDACEPGLLPTPTDPGNELGRAVNQAEKMWPTPHGICKEGPRRPGPSGNELGRAVNQAERMWLPNAVAMYPTPRASDGEKMSGLSRARRAEGRPPENLPDVTRQEEGTGALNPTWVEWLMGYPSEWTALEPSETPSSRKSSK